MVYCVLFVMMSNNIEKKSAVSGDRHVLIAYDFFLVVSLASMQIKFLKSFFQNKTPDLRLKYILIQVYDQQGQQ